MSLRRSEVATNGTSRVSDIVALSEGPVAASGLIIGATKKPGGGGIAFAWSGGWLDRASSATWKRRSQNLPLG
jgi:hypothetical protein